MVNRMKNLAGGMIMFLILTLVFQINFVNSQELTEITEIGSKDLTFHATGYEVSQDGEIIFNGENSKLIINQGKENEIVIEGNSGVKVSPLGKISVAESGSEFSLSGNSFKNIKSGEIAFDVNTGEIINADFFTNENAGSYNINGNEFKVPANQRFVYGSKKGFELPGETEVLKAKNTQIKSDGIFDYKGNKISGILNFDENGNTFVKAGEKTITNGVSIKNEGKGPDFPIFLDKNTAEISGKSEYIAADSSKNFFAFKEAGGNLPRNIRIEVNKENYLFGDLMDEKDYFFIGEGGVNPGYLEITRQGENLPVLKTQGSIEINPDEKRFLFEGENIIFKTGTNAWPIPEDRQMISGTIPMVFESQNRKVVGLIPENDDKRFYWTTKGGEVSYGPVSEITKEQLGVELPDFITKSWAENSEVWQDRANAISTFANNHKFQESYAKHLAAEKNLDKYIADAQKLEEEILIDSGREKELKEATVNLASGKITNKDFEEIVKKGKDPSMTWDEVEKIIGTDKTKKIKSELKNRAELYQIISSELSKEEDLAKDLDKFKVEGEILKFMSPNELKALNDCVGRGNSFDLCFDENYKYLGLKTLLCITNPEYCKTMTSYQFNKMRVK